jgi:hypothetical protein
VLCFPRLIVVPLSRHSVIEKVYKKVKGKRLARRYDCWYPWTLTACLHF